MSILKIIRNRSNRSRHCRLSFITKCKNGNKNWSDFWRIWAWFYGI